MAFDGLPTAELSDLLTWRARDGPRHTFQIGHSGYRQVHGLPRGDKGDFVKPRRWFITSALVQWRYMTACGNYDAPFFLWPRNPSHDLKLPAIIDNLRVNRLASWSAQPATQLRCGARAWLKNPFTEQEEIILGDPPPSPHSKSLRIAKIDYETKTVTLRPIGS